MTTKHIESINEMLKSAYLVGDLCHGIDFYGHSVEECAEAYVTHINDGLDDDPATEARKFILVEIDRLQAENQKLREALQLVRLSGGWLHLSEETKTIIIDRLDGGRVS